MEVIVNPLLLDITVDLVLLLVIMEAMGLKGDIIVEDIPLLEEVINNSSISSQ
jgi:hypothetical protein